MFFKILKYIIFVLIMFAVLLIINITPDRSESWIKAKYADNNSKYISVMDMEVHYKDEGQGFPFLLLHGTGSSLHTWDGWTEAMKDTFRIIRMDLPGFGITGPFPDRNYNIFHYSRFLDDFAKALELDSFYLAGNSLGGNIAWHYTASHQDKVKRLILVNSSGYPLAQRSSVFTLAQTPVISSLLKWITPRSLIKKNLKEVYYHDEKIDDDLVNRYYNMARREGNRQAFIDRARTPFQDHSEMIKLIYCPTLILWGQEDQWIPVDHAEKFVSDIETAELIIYPEMGHVIMEEKPQKTAKDAEAFLYKIVDNNDFHQ